METVFSLFKKHVNPHKEECVPKAEFFRFNVGLLLLGIRLLPQKLYFSTPIWKFGSAACRTLPELVNVVPNPTWLWKDRLVPFPHSDFIFSTVY